MAKRRHQYRQPTPLEFEELCDLAAKHGSGDLLSFIHGIKLSARKYHWDQQLVVDIMRHAPAAPRRRRRRVG